MSDSSRPRGLQLGRPPYPSPTPGAYSNSCPLSRWCHLTISPSVITFSSCPQSFPASGSFQMNQLLTWGGQSIGVSASTSVLPMHTQDWSPLGWTGWISLQSSQFSHSVVSDSLWPHESQHARPPLSITISQSSLKLTSIELVIPSSHLILCHPLLLLSSISSTELKEKYSLEQDELFCWVIISSGFKES